MPIRFRCRCGSKLLVPDNFAGRSVRCPACQQPTVVPNAPEAPTDEQVTTQRNRSATDRENARTGSQPLPSGAASDAMPVTRSDALTERSRVGGGSLPAKRPQRDSLSSDRPRPEQQPGGPIAEDRPHPDKPDVTSQRTERQLAEEPLAEQQRTMRQEASRQSVPRPQTENRQAEKTHAAKPPSRPIAQRPTTATPIAHSDAGFADRFAGSGGPVRRLVADASNTGPDVVKVPPDQLGTGGSKNLGKDDAQPVAAGRRVAQPASAERFGHGVIGPVADRVSESVDPIIRPGVVGDAAITPADAVQGERTLPGPVAGWDLSGGRVVPTTPASYRAAPRDQGQNPTHSASESNAIPVGTAATTIEQPLLGRFSSLVSFFSGGSDRSVPSPQLRIVDERLTASAKSLGWGLAAISLVGLLPALWAIAAQMEAADGYGVGSWVYLMLLLTLLQWAYAIYLGQLPDSSSLWIVTIFTLGLATIYAGLLGITLIARPDTDWLADLDLVEPLRGRRATGWCFIMLCLTSLMSYLCGRLSLRWSDTGRVYPSK